MISIQLLRLYGQESIISTLSMTAEIAHERLQQNSKQEMSYYISKTFLPDV